MSGSLGQIELYNLLSIEYLNEVAVYIIRFIVIVLSESTQSGACQAQSETATLGQERRFRFIPARGKIHDLDAIADIVGRAYRSTRNSQTF